MLHVTLMLHATCYMRHVAPHDRITQKSKTHALISVIAMTVIRHSFIIAGNVLRLLQCIHLSGKD